MQIHLSAEVEARLDELSGGTSAGRDEVIGDALAGYFDEVAEVRRMLDRRYDELDGGRVNAVPAAAIAAHFRAKRAGWAR